MHLIKRRFDDALIVGLEAIRLRPNCTNANGFFANIPHYCGEQTDAIEHVTWAIRYSPIYPPFFADVLALALLFDGSVDSAMAAAGESLRLNPSGSTPRLVLITGHTERGRITEAREVAEQFLASNPGFSIGRFAQRQPYRKEADLEYFLAGLNAAGLPG